MRLIDADSLKTKVEAMVVHRVIESDYDFGGNQAFDYVADILIDDAPTIDAVPVIRCKDCKFSDVYQSDSSGATAMYCRAFTFHRMVAEDDYCSYGERRTDD